VIRLWPLTNNILRVRLWLMARKTVFNRSWNREARKFREEVTRP
jgi:hypothetical protein